jgi:hypothetical protein
VKKGNYDYLFSVFNTSLLLYVFYTLHTKIVALRANITESITAIVDSSYVKFSKHIAQKIQLENKTMLEAHLKRMEDIEFSFSTKSSEFIQSTSAKTDLLVNKMLEAQIAASQKLAAPSVQIVQESNVKPLVIGAFVLLSGIIVCSYYLVPKIAVITVAKFTELQWVFTEIIKHIPGSNSATGVCHLKGVPFYKVVTKVRGGISKHVIQDTRDGSTHDLGDFILNISASPRPTPTINLSDVVNIVTSAGESVDTSVLF